MTDSCSPFLKGVGVDEKMVSGVIHLLFSTSILQRVTKGCKIAMAQKNRFPKAAKVTSNIPRSLLGPPLRAPIILSQREECFKLCCPAIDQVAQHGLAMFALQDDAYKGSGNGGLNEAMLPSS